MWFGIDKVGNTGRIASVEAPSRAIRARLGAWTARTSAGAKPSNTSSTTLRSLGAAALLMASDLSAAARVTVAALGYSSLNHQTSAPAASASTTIAANKES